MKSAFLLLFFAVSATLSMAQFKIDSLEQVLTTDIDDSLKIRTYLHLRAEYHRTDQQAALRYVIKAEELAKNAGLTHSLAEVKYRKGTTLLEMSLYKQAEGEFSEARKIFERYGDVKGVAFIKIDLARLMQIQSKTEEAITLFFEALPLVQQIGDQNAEARIYNYLGEHYKLQKQWNRSIINFKKALDLVKSLNFKPGISACLANLGAVYTEIKDFDNAIAYNEEALQMKETDGDKLGASRVLTNLGELYSLKHQFDISENYFTRAYNLARDVDHIAHQTTVEYEMARMYLKSGNLSRSIKIANTIVARLQTLKDLDMAVKTHRLLVDAYSKSGRIEEALANALIHTQLADSLYSEKMLSISNELEAKYQNEQKAKEIAILESENNIQSLLILERENERNYLIGVSIIIFLLLVLGYNQYRIKQKANARLKELDSLKSDFLANISHEFRTPLSLIMAPLREKIETSPDDHDRETYQLMYRNADRLLTLIDQLLDISKLEHTRFKLNKSSTDISQLLKIIAASFSSLAGHKRIRFNSRLPAKRNVIEIDQDILQKVCNNLLSNAFKFTSEGGEVNFDVKFVHSYLKIIVSDSGTGIPVEDQERIFDRFFQSSNSGQLGSGIGLALTKELVEFHGGKIYLEKSSPQGSIFTVIIPIEISADADLEMTNNFWSDSITTDSAIAQDDYLPRQGPVILVIEDNQDLRNYLSEILSKEYTVHLSENGKSGISKAMEIVPDLIISDVMMPVKDGIQVCKKLKETRATDHIPIILLTARADQDSKLHGLITGADDYLLKPFDPQELKVRISNLLAQRARLKEKYSKQLLQEPADMKADNSQSIFLKSARKIVNQHLDNSEFSVNDFSHALAMSRMQLHRKLTALTGQSATAFIRQQRLMKASQLLRLGEPVAQVAYTVGFSSLAYFAKNFKQEFGVAPSEFKHKSM